MTTTVRRRTLLTAAVTLLAALTACSNGGSPSGRSAGPATSSGQLAASAATTLPPPTTTTVPPTTTTTRRPAPVPDPSVLTLQKQLTSLGYWLGTPDGFYGLTTSQAVMAMQKAAGLARTGTFGADVARALEAGTRPTAQSTSGHVIEIDLAHQLILSVTGGHVDYILNTSTGGGYRFTENGVTQTAITPVGHFTTTWEVNGTRVSPLGVLWRPKFFVGGIAIHGSASIPGRPVSHGCVRVSNPAINWIWSANLDPIGTPVWVY
jgi:peptidoglycan hydrolase-like protein with peptidoglycan-binding domain